MAEGIVIKLAQPERIVTSGEYSAVIIPAQLSNLTIIPGRAPSMVALTNGLVQLLDVGFKPVEKFYIKGGYADIAGDSCIVSSEVIIDRKSITLEEAESKLNQLLVGNNGLDYPAESTEDEEMEKSNNDDVLIAEYEADTELSESKNQNEVSADLEDVANIESNDLPNKSKVKVVKTMFETLSSKASDIEFYQMIVDDLKAFS